MKKLIITLALAASVATVSAVTPQWLRNVKISPDGQQIAFTYKGDIFTVPAAGGEARRITSGTTYETTPVWSPDSRRIAYASERHGNFDIYIVDAQGGNAIRLTNNSASEKPEAFTPDGSRIYYTAAIQAPTESAMFPTTRMVQVYSVPAEGGNPRQEIGTPAQSLAFIGTDGSFLYQDVKGFENVWRKHHTSSVTKDIWKYDAKSGNHTNLTDRPGEDRNPVLTADQSTIYFLSERDGGTFNVYCAPIADLSKATPVTDFTVHPVRFLSIADNGTLAFAYDGDIYTLAPGQKPAKVAINVTLDDTPEVERISVSGRNGVPSPDGKQVAYVARGEVFVTSTEHSSTKQITHTPAAEKEVSWHPENRELVYTSMRDGHFNIYRAKIARKDDPNFSNATLIDEEPVVAADNVERTVPKYSPDGKMLAFIQDRKNIMIMDVESGKTRRLTDASVYSYSDGSYDYQWSPDSKWITLEVMDNKHDPYTDIALVNVATGELTHLTRSGYTDREPHFVMEGNAIVFLSEKYGMRNHASWGSQDDAMIVFLNQDAYDRFKLSKEDYELRKEVEKQQKKAAKKDDDKKKDDKKDKKADDGDNEKAEESNDIKVELAGIEDRVVRLTPFSSNLGGAWVDNDGKNLYFLTALEKGYDLWKMDFDEWSPSIATRLDMGYVNIYPSKDGKTLFLMGDKMKKYDVGGSSTKNISSSTNMVLDHAAEREAMFDQVYLSEREMFYDKGLHGVDWDRMASDYRRFLPHINNNDDFAELLSEMLGELNVSHTGASNGANTADAIIDRTASLGLLYDMKWDGKGIRVDEVVVGGPFDNATTAMKPGSLITAINGAPVMNQADYVDAVNNLAGKKTLIGFTAPDGSSVEEVVIPISTGTFNGLMYDRWVRNRAADVKRWSDGRLGYVHIKSMGDGSFREVYSDILGKYNQCDGVVVDIRWNGGGRLHEDIEVLLSGHKYFTQVIRGEESCDMPSRRYNKPTIMVMAEACYSNAHGTPWVYKNRNLGKLVGMPVPGTMTSVNWVTLQDPAIVFGIPVVGYRLEDGSYLENTQLEPDIRVVNLPQDIVRGEDAQLRRAVDELLRQIDNK